MQLYTIEAVNSLIRYRRSIYPQMYSGEIISKDTIRQILENANWAPTHKLTEPWRFVVFSGEGIKRLAQFQSELYKEVATKADRFSESNYDKLKTKPLLCSHIISIGMKRDEKERLHVEEEIASVACAVQNMYLTATAYGVGCYWGSGGITYYEEAKPYFGLGEKDKLLGFVYLGINKGKHPESVRRPIEEKVRWEE